MLETVVEHPAGLTRAAPQSRADGNISWRAASGRHGGADEVATRPASAGLGSSVMQRPVYYTFRSIAGQYGDNIAVEDDSLRLTYRELLEFANRLARAVRRATPEGGVVGLLLPTSAMIPVGALACLACGRPYVPLDPHYPAERNAAILGDVGLAAIILDASADATNLRIPDSVARIDIARSLAEPDGTDSEDVRTAYDPADLDAVAMILYTSGSTGRPKGIVKSQRGLLFSAFHEMQAYGIGPDDRLLALCSPTTMMGHVGMLSALLSGAAIRILDVQRAGLRDILRLMTNSDVTACLTIPTLLRSLLALDQAPASFENIRTICLAGERVLWADVQMLRRVLPAAARVRVTYGSTETLAAQWTVPCDFISRNPIAPSGYIPEGLEFAILDDDGAPVPDGEPGELVLRSRYVALGDWQHGSCVPGLIQPDPVDPTVRIFRTGDLVCLDQHGLLTVLGRRDRQIKVRGQRVEPAELEAVLLRSPAVAQAAVVTRRRDDTVALVAFVVPRSGAGNILVADLMAAIRAALPAALHPAAIHLTKALPRLPGGKLNERDLQMIDDKVFSGRVDKSGITLPAKTEASAPALLGGKSSSEVVQAVRRGWLRVLGQHALDDDESWEDSNGDSLGLLRLVFEMEQALGLSIPLSCVNPRMLRAEMVAAIEDALRTPPRDATAVPRTTVVMLPGIGGDEPNLASFRHELVDKVDFVTIDYPDWREMSRPGFQFNDLIEFCCSRLETLASSSPVRLLGYSYGGTVALCIAQRLLAAGREVAFLGLLDVNLRLTMPPRRGGIVGVATRAIGLVSAIRRGNLPDEFARVAADYLQASWARGLSQWIIQPRAIDLFARTRFALRIWLCKHRRSDLIRDWSENPPTTCLHVPTTLFRAAADCERLADGERSPDDLGWSRYCPILQIVEVPGDHISMMEVPNRHDLAERFVCALSQGPFPIMARSSEVGSGAAAAARSVAQ